MRIAAGLRKRKRMAWRAAVVVTAVVCVAHVLKGHRLGEALLFLVLLVMLVTARSRFTARSDPTSRWVAARVFLQFFTVAVVYGMAMLYLYPHRVEGIRRSGSGCRRCSTRWSA